MRIRIGATALLMGCMVGTVRAQEPINATDSATAPSPGHVIFKEQYRFNSMSLKEGPRPRRGDIWDSVLLTTANIGVTRDVSLSLRTPVLFRDRHFDGPISDQRVGGVGDITVLGKWRFYQDDSGPLDTLRLSLAGGIRIRSGDAPFTSDGYDPIVGLAATKISGRHGFNGSLQWLFSTDGNDEPIYPGESLADVLRYDAAYLFRLYPAKYSSETYGALYAVVELNGTYETNGDNELLIAPGLMYEAATWTLELSVQAPVWRDVHHRAEMDYAIVAGIRLSL